MSYLLVDDGFSRHPKMLALTPVQRWVWLDALCWASRYAKDDGALPDVADLAIPGLKTLRPSLRELGLLDAGDEIHDWYLYTTASVQQKVSWYLAKYPEASANEVVRQVRGTRSLVLAEVRKHRPDGTENGTGEPPNPVRKAVHTGARPVPSLKTVRSSKGRDVSGFARDAADPMNGAASPEHVGRVPQEEPAGARRVRDVRTNVNPSAKAAAAYVRNIGRQDPHLERTLAETYQVPADALDELLADVAPVDEDEEGL